MTRLYKIKLVKLVNEKTFKHTSKNRINSSKKTKKWKNEKRLKWEKKETDLSTTVANFTTTSKSKYSTIPRSVK